jgi:hypothetical protein
MPSHIEVQDQMLVVTLTGRVVGSDVEAAQTMAARVADERGLRKVLVDMRSADPRVGMMDIFDLHAALFGRFSLGTRHAVVFSPETYDPRNAKFGEDVAVNRGISVKTFTRIREATDWLDDGESRL